MCLEIRMLLDPDTDALQRHRRSRNDDIFSIVQRKLAQGNGPALDQRRLDGKPPWDIGEDRVLFIERRSFRQYET